MNIITLVLVVCILASTVMSIIALIQVNTHDHDANGKRVMDLTGAHGAATARVDPVNMSVGQSLVTTSQNEVALISGTFDKSDITQFSVVSDDTQYYSFTVHVADQTTYYPLQIQVWPDKVAVDTTSHVMTITSLGTMTVSNQFTKGLFLRYDFKVDYFDPILGTGRSIDEGNVLADAFYAQTLHLTETKPLQGSSGAAVLVYVYDVPSATVIFKQKALDNLKEGEVFRFRVMARLPTKEEVTYCTSISSTFSLPCTLYRSYSSTTSFFTQAQAPGTT